MKLSRAAQLIDAQFSGTDVEFDGVSIDTRTLQPGNLFFALKGPNFDAHDYLDKAEQAGAVAAVVSHPVETQLPCIIVPNVHQALMALAEAWRDQYDLPLVAVTGSCGKTTTRQIMLSVFSQAGNVLASQKSYNNNIGVPLTLLGLKPEHDYAITELGANHPGEIAELTHLVKPDVAIITLAGESHLEFFHDVAGVASAKGEIYQGLKPSGTAVINADDDYCDFWKRLAGSHNVLTFGVDHPADISAKDIEFNRQTQAHFTLVTPAGDIHVQLQMIGRHNVMNALAAAAAGHALGLTLEQIKHGLESAQPEQRRLVMQAGYAGAMVIDDSYNANPRSVSAALDILAQRDGSSVLVLGDMLELGPKTDEFHQEMGRKAAELGITRVYCFGQHARHTAEAFGTSGFAFDSRDELIDELKLFLDKNVTVLVKGSNSTKMNLVAQAILEQ